jgi:NDP-sugar pyrophosphorylase family protein/thiamine kinase-like enzyme
MGNYTTNFNKALLPYQQKPVLAHIIDNFPEDTKFIIPVGFMSQQIKDFCTIAYSDRDITFVEIDDYSSTLSGTAYTLKLCQEQVSGPFWYIPCDTYFNQNLIGAIENKNKDYYFVKKVANSDAHLYTTFNIIDDSIKDIVFKQPVIGDEHMAFTGVMYIHDYQYWWDTLNKLESNEFIYNIPIGSATTELESWIDFGCPEIYQRAVSVSQKFDFGKKDEITYICNNRVVKWWRDESISEKKYKRVQDNKAVYPNNVEYLGHYMGYDLHPGTTLYQLNEPKHFAKLLDWLNDNVWKQVDCDITDQCVDFYKIKSLSRIQKYLEIYPNRPNVTTVDGVSIKDYSAYLNNIDWEYLTQCNESRYIHGDLQFDNIIFDGDFKLIDWRHEFAGLTHTGDVYYDLAKLLGGTIISYAMIKEHHFNIEFNEDAVTLSIPYVDNHTVYRTILKEWVNNNGLDWRKVEMLVPLIYWNMAPLHTAPFDQFLWYLGLKLWAENEIL